MPQSFYEIAFTPTVKAQQTAHNSRTRYQRKTQSRTGQNQLGEDEQAFLALRDSFYMASVSETGWPCIQHRGGPAGFLNVLRARLQP